MVSEKRNGSDGYVVLGAIILLALSTIAITVSLTRTRTSLRTAHIMDTSTEEYYLVEDSIGKAVSWLRDNSTAIASSFIRNEYYSKFDTSTVPAFGGNEGSIFFVPSMLNVNGTANSPILSTSNSIVTASYPDGYDLDTNAPFLTQSTFSSATLGSSEIRVTLISASPVDQMMDYGDTDLGNPTPETDFEPVFRIDAMSGIDNGAHIYAYVQGRAVYESEIGFYGENFVDIRQDCDSYESANGAYSGATKRPYCKVGTNGNMMLHQSETVYGGIESNGSIVTTAPWGGDVCADFSAGCPTPGELCEGADCGVPLLPVYEAWGTYCPADQGNVVVNKNSTTTLTVTGSDPLDKCWDKIQIEGPNGTLRLTSTAYPYFIDELDIDNNAMVEFVPDTVNGTIELYVKKFTGDKFNGNQTFNMPNKPFQLKIHYLGTDALTLNGNADMKSFIIAPYASVDVQGNFDYYGGIKALDLTFTGSGNIHYDESGYIPKMSDLTFEVTKSGQYMR